MKKSILIISILYLFSTVFLNSEMNAQHLDAVVSGCDSLKLMKAEHMSYATVWFQKSAENRAVYYQTFNLAKMMLDKNLKEDKSKRPNAIITDIDETIIDNSAFQARLLDQAVLYSETDWEQWELEKNAKAMPGAVEFCNYAKNKKVEVFYVSNRSTKNLEATIENLKNLGFPYADKEHMLFKEDSSDKTGRRNKVAEKYDVILLLGDNLRDFDEIFGKRGEDFGFKVVDGNKDQFGKTFIVFPNPMYGEWEKPVYKNNFKRTDEEKRKMRIDALDK
jgi:5'-nucleotidase (lipoprotein e(P4) family)